MKKRRFTSRRPGPMPLFVKITAWVCASNSSGRRDWRFADGRWRLVLILGCSGQWCQATVRLSPSPGLRPTSPRRGDVTQDRPDFSQQDHKHNSSPSPQRGEGWGEGGPMRV